jgi:hypothetical protein
MADGGIGNQSPATLFQARLDTTDGVSNTLTLGQYLGNKVVVSGVTVKIPGAGLTRGIADNLIDLNGADAGSAPLASTLYFVYISNRKATFSPESIRLSSQAPTPVNGVRYLGTSGNKLNWRFVGWVMPNATPQFESSQTSRLIINLYNRFSLAMYANPAYLDNNAVTTYPVTAGNWTTPAAAVGPPTISQLQFISNGQDEVSYLMVGQGEGNPNGTPMIGVGEDSQTNASMQAQLGAGGGPFGSMTVGKDTLFPEGPHTLDMLIAGSGGNVLFLSDFGRIQGGTFDTPATYMTARVRG